MAAGKLEVRQKRAIAIGCGFVAALLVVAIALALIITAILGSVERDLAPAPAAPPVAEPPKGEPATFVSTVDGDTIKTSEGNVRIIGIDTPERGECGYREATDAIERLIGPGEAVYLDLPEGQHDSDRWGRMLRYVATDTGIDIGLMQLEAGNAVARYDSTDGYPTHPKETEYHASQTATRGPDGSVLTIACG